MALYNILKHFNSFTAAKEYLVKLNRSKHSLTTQVVLVALKSLLYQLWHKRPTPSYVVLMTLYQMLRVI